MDEPTVKRLAHISNEEVEKDIADTQCEIDELRQRKIAYDNLALSGPEHEKRLYRFKADAIPHMIEERSVFIGKLRELLEARDKGSS